jgi:Domain of unknown function (DUF4118)
MGTRVLSLLIRPMSPSLASRIVVGVALIMAETLVAYLLRRVASEISPGVVHLVSVLVVSSVWGPALGVVTAVLSAAAMGFFHVPPSLDFGASDPLGRGGAHDRARRRAGALLRRGAGSPAAVHARPGDGVRR